MKHWKTYVAIGALLGAGIAMLGGALAQPVMAQVRAALVRDVDTPSLSPVRLAASYDLNSLNDQRLLTTVPAGKRLVIEYVSYWAYAATGTQIVFGALRNGQFGPLSVILEIHPAHTSAATGLFIQDGSQPVKAYFEAGEEVWVSASKSAGGLAHVEVFVQGHLITP